MTGNAEVLLARAIRLLDAPQGAAAGNAARLSAFLARQAVEELIDARCADLCRVQTVTGTTKAKLAVLKSLDTTANGNALIGAWHRLTGFCHQHAYRLDPTVAEVREECLTVDRDCLAQRRDRGSDRGMANDYVADAIDCVGPPSKTSKAER